jgi:succinate dehydrogenase / fumarate reductase cytochrome b subunit
MNNKKALSSITKKVIMSLAGLFLITFLLVHLGINLFLLPITEDHKQIFLDSADFMATFPPMKIMELVLFLGFIIHIFYGIVVQLQNWSSRGTQSYAVASKTQVTLSAKTMIYSGIVVFLFLALHLYQFYFVKLGLNTGAMLPGGEHPDFYTIAVTLFSTDAVFSSIYILAFVVLWLHLRHAFQSAFQTLGLNHVKYTPFIKALGEIYSIVVPLGFIMVPLYYMIWG